MDDDDIEICDIVNEIEKKEAPKKDISTDKNKVKGTLDAFFCKKELEESFKLILTDDPN